MEPSGRNQWQPVANARDVKTAPTSQSVATGCDQLPIAAHGKEGVDGSSPSEGSYESPATRGVSFFFRAIPARCISIAIALWPTRIPRPRTSSAWTRLAP